MGLISEVDLSDYANRFDNNKLTDLKRKNYIYGKNGTGKSTIARAIKKQYNTSHHVFLFSGFEELVGEDTQLDAISLGKENAENQAKINQLNSEIESLTKQATSPDSPIVIEFNRNSVRYNEQQNEIESFYTTSARTIGNLREPVLVHSRQYNKRNFKNDIPDASKLDQEAIQQLVKKASAKQINVKNPLTFPVLNSRGFENATQSILATPLSPSTTIKELADDPQKKEFAQTGMHIHEKGDRCAFCGNIISPDRWKELDSFFSKSVSDFETRIDNALTQVKGQLNLINSTPSLSTNDFFDHLQDRVSELNDKIADCKNDNIIFLNSLTQELISKKNHEFTVLKLEDIPLPTDFSKIQELYNQLYEDNKSFHTNLDDERERALKKLRLDKVSRLMSKFNYESHNNKLEVFKETLHHSQEGIQKLESTLSAKKAELANLIADSKSEHLAVEKMNQCLDDLGNQSFNLTYVPNKSGQKGLYTVSDKDGNTRGISHLSTGEKNLVAFLYFMNSLNSVDVDTMKDSVVIFDDPINSNDDSIQYLIIALIKALHKQENCPQLFVFTHNNNFYSQVTPPNHHYRSNSVGYFHLTKADSKTHIQMITNENEDLSSLYDELWKELHFAYDHNKTIFMWNIMRRILETYNRFVYANSSLAQLADKQLSGSEGSVFILGLTKGLNENSHLGDEMDIDIGSFSRKNLLTNFEKVFQKLDTDEHFKAHWNQ